MNKVATINGAVKNITAPNPLKDLKAWLVWRYEETEDRDKPNKVPYYTDGTRRRGEQGAESDRNRLATFDAARSYAASKDFDGIGFALMPEFGITALDFDDCVTSSGIHPDVEALITDTYAEYSPSGEGIRAFVMGKLPDRKDVNKIPYGFETFSNKGYVTVTGNMTELTRILNHDDVLAPINDETYTYYQQRFGPARNDADFVSAKKPLGVTAAQFIDGLGYLNPEMGYDPWLKLGMAIHFELDGDSTGFDIWDNWSSTADKYPGRNKLATHWRSFSNKADGRVITGAYFVRMANDAGATIRISEVATEADFEKLTQSSDEGEKPEPDLSDMRFVPVSAKAFSQRKPPAWIVKRVIPEGEVGLVIGQSGTGKSFVIEDIGMSIARGVDWRGHKVKQGRVVWIAAEGIGGVTKRLQAYEQHHGIDLADVPFDVIGGSPDFVKKEDPLDIAKAIVATGGARLIIVDTLAQVTPGSNENSGEDMSVAIKHCQGINRATGAMVVLVHHVGKDQSRGARGWSGLKAAADFEMEVQRNARTGERLMRISKQKDGDDNAIYGFDLEVVTVGWDEDGDVIDSCVVVEADAPSSTSAVKRGRNEVKAIEVLADNVPTDGSGVALDYLIDELALELERGTGKRDTRKQKAKTVLNKLLDEENCKYFYDGKDVSVAV